MSLTTGTNALDSLIAASWNDKAGLPAQLTYSFLQVVPASAPAKDHVGFVPMSVAQQAATKVAMAAWAAVANVSFTQVASGGNIQLGTNDQDNVSSGYAYYPNGNDKAALFLNNQDNFNSLFTAGTYGPSVLIHELGHNLGLKHPGNYNSTGGQQAGPFLPDDLDNRDYSVMAYDNGPSYQFAHKYSVTPMLMDIQAIQYLYGANMTYHTGADTYSFARTAPLTCIWDAGGNDTFDFSACRDATVIDLRAGGFSSTAPNYNNISIAYGVTIERAVAGSGGSTIIANDSGNTIVGGAGTDYIHEGAGNDQISGSGGDQVIFDKALAGFTISGSPGALTVSGDGVDTINGIKLLQFGGKLLDVSAYRAVQGGSAGNDVISARAGAELITGGGGVDVVKFAGAHADYQVAASGVGTIVADRVGSGGSDMLAGIERLEFSDHTGLALDTNGAAGQMYRLYGAMFNRTPDAAGMGYWLDALDHGTQLSTVAANFITSREFIDLYGANASDAVFVTALYQNVLHRAPDNAGFAFWLNDLAHGTERAAALTGFSDSAENIAAVNLVIPVGISYTPWV